MQQQHPHHLQQQQRLVVVVVVVAYINSNISIDNIYYLFIYTTYAFDQLVVPAVSLGWRSGSGATLPLLLQQQG